MLNDAAYPGKFLFLGAFRKRPARTQALAGGGQIARIFKRGVVGESRAQIFRQILPHLPAQKKKWLNA